MTKPIDLRKLANDFNGPRLEVVSAALRQAADEIDRLQAECRAARAALKDLRSEVKSVVRFATPTHGGNENGSFVAIGPTHFKALKLALKAASEETP